MQEAEDLVGAVHVADVGVPGSVGYAVAEAREDVDDDEGRVGRVLGDDDVGGDVAGGGDDGDAALADFQVDPVVEQGGEDVTHKGGEEDQRDDDVGEVVV